MEHQSIISAIDAEIARMEKARKLLAQGSSIDGAVVRRATTGRKPAKKRTMSPEGRKRIAEAQRKRWAKTHRLAALSAIGRTSKKAAKKASGVPF